MGAPRAVVVGAEVDCLATERAAVVDEFLVFLDSHVEGSYGRREVGQVLTWWEGGVHTVEEFSSVAWLGDVFADEDCRRRSRG